MRRQKRRMRGVSAVAAVAVVAVLVAAGAGVFGFTKMMDADRVMGDLTRTRADLEKARADLKKAALDVANATKETNQLKITTEQLTAERDSVRKVMAEQQATGEQMRAELQLAKEQISYLSARTSKEVVRGMPKSTR